MNAKTQRITIWILLAGLLFVLAACRSEEPVAQAETTEAAAVDATSAPAAQAIETGTVTAEGELLPARSVALAFQTAGTVAEVLAVEGQAVEAGQVLIRLDSALVESAVQQATAGLEAANAGLSAAQAQLALAETQKLTAEAALKAAEAQLALVKAGPRPEQIAAAERALAAAEAGVAQAAAQRDEALNVSDTLVRAAEAQLAAALSRYTALRDGYDTLVTTCVELPDGSEICPGLGAPEENLRAQVEAAEAAYNAAQAAVAEARAGATAAQQQSANAGVTIAAAQRDVAAAQLALLKAGARDEQIQRAELGVEQARLGLTQADVSAEQARSAVSQAEAGVRNAEAALAAAQSALERMALAAPFAGIIGEITVEAGELVSPGNPVGRLADVTQWTVETTDLVELDVVQLAESQPVEVTLDAIPGEVLRGTVMEIGLVPVLTRGDVTYRVKIALDDYPDLPLRWGMTAQVGIDTDS